MHIYSLIDTDFIETLEWIDSLLSVLNDGGINRCVFLLKKLIKCAEEKGCFISDLLVTPYKNTIYFEDEYQFPGNVIIENKINSIIRWNALILVLRSIKKNIDIGGHIGSFASISMLYDVGFNYFWQGSFGEKRGDLIYFQGHTAPGIYSRSFLEGVFEESYMNNFRFEIFNENSLSSYPHPLLMSCYWQFPTVSLGTGPLQAVYQAKFLKYLNNRKIINDVKSRRVWCFCGDGEMDEPESLAALSVAGRENLDNLIFIINCNLQRLDGPVRGNSKIIQEFESIFRGFGWHVIKVIWGKSWDNLFAKDDENVLIDRMEEVVDGDYQNYRAKGVDYIRKNFFGKNDKLKNIIKDFCNNDIENLEYGGHDINKIYSSYCRAINLKEKPVVILAKTVKGYGLGSSVEASNSIHSLKSVTYSQLIEFRNRFFIPVCDNEVKNISFYKNNKSKEINYLVSKRNNLGGNLPDRKVFCGEEIDILFFDKFIISFIFVKKKIISTTMFFVQILSFLCGDKFIGKRIVPIISDEARTFGIETIFRKYGIYSSVGQLYEPIDVKQFIFYKESKEGQILEEGISEAGSICSWIAAATSYSINNKIMIPFYIFYSIFGFQRIGDFIFAASDARARGFLIGATAGRTTLSGEGLQHLDGNSHILSQNIHNCISYDPAFGYELAVIILNGLKRIIENQEDIFFYITTYNENYINPEINIDDKNSIISGIYKFKSSSLNSDLKVCLLGSGAIFTEVIKASEVLENELNISTDIWSVTSFNELFRDGMKIDNYNKFNYCLRKKIPLVTKCFIDEDGPIISVTDYVKIYAEQIRKYIKGYYLVLGTDGFGCSDSRINLRKFFGIDKYNIIFIALKGLLDLGKIDKYFLFYVIDKYKLFY